MNLKKFTVILMAGSLFLMTGCSLNNVNNETLKEENIAIEEEKIDPIKEKIQSMDLDEKIGQLIMCGIEGTSLNENDKSLIRDYHIGGVILFGHNIQSFDQAVNFTNAIKDENSNNKIPLFISVDEEGGTVSRMPSQFKKVPSAKILAARNDEKFIYDVFSIIGEEVSSIGINMDYAPVLDINSNPNNTVIGSRAFGKDADVVSKMGISAMNGLKKSNVIPVVKHFPGHGDTSMDSHINLPIVYKTKEELENFEFIPFKKTIENGCDAVMVSHILLNKIDADNPASFSKVIINDILRKDMNFNGVIITDDMTMGAIIENYSLVDACVNSIKAGSDIVMICCGYENIKQVFDSLKKSVEDNIISMDRIDESVYRILTLKEKYKLKDTHANMVDINGINNKLTQLLNN